MLCSLRLSSPMQNAGRRLYWVLVCSSFVSVKLNSRFDFHPPHLKDDLLKDESKALQIIAILEGIANSKLHPAEGLGLAGPAPSVTNTL